MSNSSRGPAQLSIAPEMPRGEVVGRYRTYAQAQKAVDHMADENFPVAMVSIIGSDLKSVEQVTGRLTYPRVALQGALNGIVFGAFFGLLMSWLGGANMAVSLGLTMVLGGAFWMLMATITYALSRGKRDFTSTSRIVAGSYEVLAAPEVAGQARQLLGAMERGQVPQGQAPRQGGHWGDPRTGGFQGGPGHGPANQGPVNQGAPYGTGGRDAGGAPGQQAPSQQYAPQHSAPGHQGTQHQGGQQHPAQGVNGPVNGQDNQGHPAGGDGSQDPNQVAAQRSSKFPDLPDGRPQYGIRLEPQTQGSQPVQNAQPVQSTQPMRSTQQAQPAPRTEPTVQTGGASQAQPQSGAAQGAPWDRPADDGAASAPSPAERPEDRRES